MLLDAVGLPFITEITEMAGFPLLSFYQVFFSVFYLFLTSFQLS